MGFRRNYLPSQSQPWTREVQSRVEAMERDVVLSDINNRTRDDQLQSSYNRLDSAFVTLATQQTTLESQQTELTTVSGEADDALQAAITANGLAISAGNAASDANAEALDALQKIIDLGSPGGPTINASNLSAGTITGVTIQGNVITGGSISGTSISGGSITSVSSLEVPFGPVFGQTVSASSNISSQGGLQRDQLAGGGTTGASITSGGYFVRTSSSARYKTDIEDAEFSLESVLQLQPKTFRLKEEVEEEPEDAITYPGFIAEDIAGTPLDVFVNYETLDDGTQRPEGVRYAELTAALVSAMKQQDANIKTLEARLDALEAK